jgi:hypothetical protein
MDMEIYYREVLIKQNILKLYDRKKYVRPHNFDGNPAVRQPIERWRQS